MKPSSTIRSAALGIGLLACALGSGAATLGRMQGAALIGRPLELSVQVQLSEGEEAVSPCLEADVFHADNRQDPGRIRVTYQPGAQAQSGVVRIVSATPVDEPLVTVYLRAGCSQKSSRRYVLLADVVSDVLAAPAPTTAMVNRATSAPPVRAQSGAIQSGAEPAKPQSSAMAPARAAAPSTPEKATPRRLTKAPRPAQPSDDAKARVRSALGKSRLKLDMLDLTQERDPTLRVSSELLSVPTDSASRRAEAAALWRALNASPEDILRDGARVHAMDADISALKAITARNQLGLKDLGARLRQAESERYANWLVYSLGGLLLLSIVALAWLWRRRQSPREDWWRGSEMSASGQTSRLPETADTARPAEVAPAAALAPALTQVDIDLGAPAPRARSQPPARPVAAPDRGASPSTPAPAPAKRGSAPNFGLSTGGHLRDVHTQELVDIRHQAEFFMSLGQADQAIEILEHRLEESGESSPLVFLDLLGIFHALGRKSEYELLRGDFNRLFTGRMPMFTAYADQGQTLDAYPEVVQHIVALWPSARVLEFMEDCIFRNPGDESGPTFDMAAYGELLLLHGVAKRIIRVPTDGVESKSAGLMRSPFKTNTVPVPVEASRRGLAPPVAESTAPPLTPRPGQRRPDDDAMMHFNLPDPR